MRFSLNINKKLELPIIKQTLKDAHLIDISQSGDISILGITTSGVLTHTSEIFNESSNNFQKASLELTNYSSDKPIKEKLLKEYIGDNYKLDSKTNTKLFQQSEDIGIIDFEQFDGAKTYFNGNLFKRDSVEKTAKVLSSLSSDDAKKVSDLDILISKDGCVTIETALTILGQTLMSKLQSIAMYDFNEVSNNQHSKIFLTKPSSFAKFGNPFEDDALDLAKAFISSLIYGLRLLKYDIAQIALDVIEKGDLAEKSTLESGISSTSVSNYTGPEENRWKVRRKKSTSPSLNVGELLRTMRN